MINCVDVMQFKCVGQAGHSNNDCKKGNVNKRAQSFGTKISIKIQKPKLQCNASRQKQQQSLSVCPNQQQRNER